MVTTVRSLGLQGISGYEVTVECFLSGGLPAFDVVGLGDTAVKEARERVRAAIKNCGAKFPVSRITVNLAPANLKKEGTVYDLPLLLGILAGEGEIDAPDPASAFIGELSLTPVWLPGDPAERLVASCDVNRPGLALSGFFDYFDSDSIKIVG